MLWPIPDIAQFVMQLFASRDPDKKWAKAIPMMRHGFGEHLLEKPKVYRKREKEGKCVASSAKKI